jgi:hypothetical protein
MALIRMVFADVRSSSIIQISVISVPSVKQVHNFHTPSLRQKWYFCAVFPHNYAGMYALKYYYKEDSICHETKKIRQNPADKTQQTPYE